MKKLLLFISCFHLLFVAFGQQRMEGKIIEKNSGIGIPGVNIWSLGSKKGASTDREGNYSIVLDQSDDQLEISSIGFKTLVVPKEDLIKSPVLVLEQTLIGLGEIVVTGFENNRSLLESTGSIGIANERDFARSDKSSLAQMLNHIPGVQVRGASLLRPAAISIRGQGARAPGQTGRIKVYLNDLILTNADGTNALEDIDPFTVGSVEVIKGPASSIYGATVGGVLNIKTQSAPFGENSLEAFSLIGSFNSRRMGTTYRLSDGKINLMATVGEQMTDGFRDHSQETRNFATFLGTFQTAPKAVTTVFFNRNRYAAQAPGALTPSQVEENPKQALPLAIANNSSRDIQFTRIGISNEWDITGKWKNITSVTTSFSDFQHPLPTLYVFQWSQNFGLRTRFVHQNTLFGKNVYITLGGEFNDGLVRSNFYGIENGRPSGRNIGDRENKIRNEIIFGQAEIELTEKLLLTGGLSANFFRYENLELSRPGALVQSRDFDPFYAPRVAFNYRPLKNIAFHGNISRGFTPPSTGDINRPDGTTNFDLREEKAINYELGTRGNLWNGLLEYDLSFYRINLFDEILTRTPEIGFIVRENAGKTSYKGIEAYLRANLIRDKKGFVQVFSSSLGMTLQETVFIDFSESFNRGGTLVESDVAGNLIPGNPPSRIFASVEAGTRWGIYGFVNMEHVARTAINNQNTVFNDAFTFMSTKFGWRGDLSKKFGLNVYAGINNLLDQIYSDGPALNPNPIAAGPLAGQLPYLNINWGRNYFLALDLKYRFK